MKSPPWKIKKLISKGDYIYTKIPNHPKSTKHGYILEHRIIMENHLGRILTASEIIHHKNGNKKDNRIENLELTNKSKHARNHMREHGLKMVELKCPFCNKVFNRQHNLTHLGRGNAIATYCSRSCNGKMSRQKQLGKISREEYNKAIAGNVIKEYLRFIEE